MRDDRNVSQAARFPGEQKVGLFFSAGLQLTKVSSKNDQESGKRFVFISDYFKSLIKYLELCVTHERYFINDEDLYISPHLFVILSQCSLGEYKCSFAYSDSTNLHSCCSSVCCEKEGEFTPSHTSCTAECKTKVSNNLDSRTFPAPAGPDKKNIVSCS